jgi:hypothetical protein
VFSSRALHFSPQLLADLGPEPLLASRRLTTVEQPDFPLEEYVGAMQDTVMYELFSPDVMSRLADEPLKARARHATMSLDDLFGWMQASVWDDLGPGATVSIDPLHRALATALHAIA